MIRFMNEKKINYNDIGESYDAQELSKEEFIDILKSKGVVTVSWGTYRLLKAEKDTFSEKQYPGLYDQLVDEGKKGYYIVAESYGGKGDTTLFLPIQNRRSDKWLTKWFFRTKDAAIAYTARDLSSKRKGLLRVEEEESIF